MSHYPTTSEYDQGFFALNYKAFAFRRCTADRDNHVRPLLPDEEPNIDAGEERTFYSVYEWNAKDGTWIWVADLSSFHDAQTYCLDKMRPSRV